MNIRAFERASLGKDLMRLRLPLWMFAAAALAGCSDPGRAASPVARADAPAPPSAAASPAIAASAPPTPPIPAPTASDAAVGDATQTAAITPPEAAAAAAPSQDPRAAAIDQARLETRPVRGWSATLVRAQVLLARARFSPGEIDGRDGENFRNALSAYEAEHGLPADGRLDPGVWQALTGADPAPVLESYVLTDADLAGPFTPPQPPDDLAALSRLDRLDYASPEEMLAERFRMDEALLKALNPGVDFRTPGARILVAAAAPTAPIGAVSRIEVDKTARQVRALGRDGRRLATYPATVGSTERPAPSGDFKVTGVARNPTYTYDPKRLTYGDKALGKLTIKPGPNNPVGVVWIALNIPTYGIHGAPEPRLVGKVASHGCVRLTNWDAADLAAGVKPGVKVSFVGVEAPAGGNAASRPDRAPKAHASAKAHPRRA